MDIQGGVVAGDSEAGISKWTDSGSAREIYEASNAGEKYRHNMHLRLQICLC